MVQSVLGIGRGKTCCSSFNHVRHFFAVCVLMCNLVILVRIIYQLFFSLHTSLSFSTLCLCFLVFQSCLFYRRLLTPCRDAYTLCLYFAIMSSLRSCCPKGNSLHLCLAVYYVAVAQPGQRTMDVEIRFRLLCLACPPPSSIETQS